MPKLNPDFLKIGYVILAATRKPAIEAFQRKAGYGESSKWTHVAGSIGGYDIVEAAVPRSRVANIQKEYVDRGFEIKVMRRRGQHTVLRSINKAEGELPLLKEDIDKLRLTLQNVK